MQTHVSEAELLKDFIDEETGEIIYPESDGKPMAESTTHFEHITTIKGNIESLFANRTDVFVAGDLLWYPVEGKPYISAAPDTMVAFGRPKGHRGSYEQWNEDNIAPQVVIEVLSKGNTAGEMIDKFIFYEKYGVQEYYVYDFLREKFYAWLREEDRFRTQLLMPDFKSPLLGIRFELFEGDKLKIYHPEGTPFLTFVEQNQKMKAAEEVSEEEKARAEEEKARAEEEKARAEEEKARAERAEEEISMLKKLLKEKGFELE